MSPSRSFEADETPVTDVLFRHSVAPVKSVSGLARWCGDNGDGAAPDTDTGATDCGVPIKEQIPYLYRVDDLSWTE